MTQRTPILLMLAALLAMLALVVCQPIPVPASPPASTRPTSSSAVVERAERRHGLPAGSLAQVWSMECSRQTVPGPACRNKPGERGAFQMTRLAAQDVGCDWNLLGQPGNFAYEAGCAAAYLKRQWRRCGDIRRAQGAFNLGRCSSASRYAREVARR